MLYLLCERWFHGMLMDMCRPPRMSITPARSVGQYIERSQVLCMSERACTASHEVLEVTEKAADQRSQSSQSVEM